MDTTPISEGARINTAFLETGRSAPKQDKQLGSKSFVPKLLILFSNLD